MSSRNKVAVLVTGASGWLGKGLVQALINGIDGHMHLPKINADSSIRVFIRPEDDDRFFTHLSKNIEIFRGDIRYEDSCKAFFANADDAILYHTAGVIHPKCIKEFYDVNLEGTKNILNQAIANRLKRAVIVSSNSPIGCNPSTDHVFTEQSAFNPYMNYGRSKMLMEQHVAAVQSKGLIETVVIRAPWFYGPFQPPRQTLFFTMIRDGKGPIVGDGKNMRSMAYIDNLCQGLILAGNSEIANGKTYWIADARPYSMNEIIDTVENVLENNFHIICKHKRLKLPAFFSDIAFICDFLIQKTGLYQQKIHVLSEMNKNIACSVALAKTELGYNPTISLAEGMRRSIAWMLENGIKIDSVSLK